MDPVGINRAKVLASHLSTADAPQKFVVPQVVAGDERKLRRAVIVDGRRTPFCKSFTDLEHMNSLELGCESVKGLIEATKLNVDLIDEVIWGNVILSTASPNIAREIVLELGLPKHISGQTVSKACLSGLQAIVNAVYMIEHGAADIIIAGGSDSMSNAELPLSNKVSQALGHYQYGKDKGIRGIVNVVKEVGPLKNWLPKSPSVSERSTGHTMGYHADMMAQINHVSRQSQDDFAISSHLKATASQNVVRADIVHVQGRSGKMIVKDGITRPDISPDKLATLKPAFRPESQGGTVTAASSTPLTDGASAVLIMSEEKARQLGYPTDISLAGYVCESIDPNPQLLLAPAIALPKLLKRTGVSLHDIDVFEIHEAFAAQVLATLAVLESEEFAHDILKQSKPVGKIPKEKINVHGGSLAVGHPFSATGGRLVTLGSNELRRSKKKYCLISICAAGGMGGVALLERHD